MTDERPRPKYGEYGPVQPVLPPPVAPVATPAVPRRSRTWDVALTAGLLVIAAWDVATAFPRFADLGSALQEAYTVQGIGEFGSSALAASLGLVINVVRIILFAVVAVLSLLQLARGRTAFWIPLAGAAVSGLVVLACVLAVVLQDPAFTDYVLTQTGQ